MSLRRCLSARSFKEIYAASRKWLFEELTFVNSSIYTIAVFSQ